MSDIQFHDLDHVSRLLNRVLKASTADETELVWLERRRGWIGGARGRPRTGLEEPLLTVLVRTVRGGRLGWYRTHTASASELENGIRQAIALSTLHDRVKKQPVLPHDRKKVTLPKGLHDPNIAELRPDSALGLVEELKREGERGRLRWSDSRLAVFNSHGLQRAAAASDIQLEVRTGDHPGSGRAATAARTLEDLDPAAVFERARALDAQGPVDSFPQGPIPVLLAPEAVIQLLNVLNTFAFSGRSFLDGVSILSRHRNIQVFDRALNVRDDGTDPEGLPFPFDFEGSPKRPIDLIYKGQPSTPALDRQQGAKAGLRPTAQAVGGGDALFGNLFLECGEATEDELLTAADEGIRIGWLDMPECLEPSQLHIRAIARGVRRIVGGRLGAPLPDLVWEESLLRAFGRLGPIGQDPVVQTVNTAPLGGFSAPAMVLLGVEGFSLLEDGESEGVAAA